MNDVARADDGSVLEPLEVLGRRARITLGKGEDLTIVAAAMVVEARRRIEGGEAWEAGRTFKDWCEIYLNKSRHSAAKLLTWGGWKDVKKGLPASTPDAVAKKVERVMRSDNARRKKNRDKEKSGRPLFSGRDVAAAAPLSPPARTDAQAPDAADLLAAHEHSGRGAQSPDSAGPPRQETTPPPAEPIARDTLLTAWDRAGAEERAEFLDLVSDEIDAHRAAATSAAKSPPLKEAA